MRAKPTAVQRLHDWAICKVADSVMWTGMATKKPLSHLSVLSVVEVEFSELPDGVQVFLVLAPVGGAQQFPRLPQMLRDQRLQLLLGVNRVQRFEPLRNICRQDDVLRTTL